MVIQPKPGSRPLQRVALTASLIAIAIVLHIFKIPFPPAPFLKFDACGIPLAIIALYSIIDSIIVTPIFLLGVLAMGADIMGALMKTLAEFATFIPLGIAYRYLYNKFSRPILYIILMTIAIASRIGIMSIANYFITPWWLAMTYGMPFDVAYKTTLGLLPLIAIFNMIIALYISPIALSIYRIIEHMGIKT